MLQSIDPARGDVVGEIAITPVQEIPQVVAQSRAAQVGWAAMGLSARAQAIKSAAVEMEARAE